MSSQLLASTILIPALCPADFHGSLTATSNYVYRGYSKTNNEFAYQANLDYQHETGIFAGASLSNVDFGDHEYVNAAQLEITPYIGWSFKISDDWRADLQWTRYLYNGNVFGSQSDYNEFYLLIHYSDLLSANLSFSDDYYNQGIASGNYELTGRYSITDYLQISSNIGYSQTKKVLEYDYLYWNAGVTLFYKFASLDLRYVDAMEMQPHQVYSVNTWPYDPALIKPSFQLTVTVGF